MTDGKSIKEDLRYWSKLTELLGWKVVAFTGRETATYFDSDNKTIQLTARQRDDIFAAIVDTGR